MSALATVPAHRGWDLQLGRTFLHPAFDYLVIGGGLSLVLTAFLSARGPARGLAFIGVGLPAFLFFSNLAHFAASTVRLYTKPRAFETYRFLTMAFPLVSLAVLTLAIWQAEGLGANLQALYLTWSPYHYAAQAYGLAVMYCYRSGCELTGGEKRLLRGTCLLPFLFSFLSTSGSGIEWFVSPLSFVEHPAWHLARGLLGFALGLLSLLLPVGFFALIMHRGKSMPLISLLVVAANGVWWVALTYMDAFIWATVFHGLQYLAITLIFHVRERLKEPANRHGWLHHALRFYGLSVLLGYGLFQLLPFGYTALGFGWAESVLLVVAAINVHHFIVDAYIWRLRQDPNYAVVTGAPAYSPVAS